MHRVFAFGWYCILYKVYKAWLGKALASALAGGLTAPSPAVKSNEPTSTQVETINDTSVEVQATGV